MQQSPDQSLAAVAATQHGVFTRAQAQAAGLSNHQLARRLTAGRIRRESTSVFAFAGVPPTNSQQIMAAVLAIDEASASHESAAHLQRFEPKPLFRLVLLVPHSGSKRSSTALIHRTTYLPARHIEIVDGIRTTTVVRTILDLGAVYQRARMTETLDWAITARRTSIGELVDEFNAMASPGRRGLGKLRPLLLERSDGQAVPASVLERRFREVVVEHGLSMPVAQWSPPWGGTLIGRVDFAYLDEQLVIEVDGRRWHTRVNDFEVDHRRDQLAVMAGWRVLRFTYRQVTERPGEVADTIRSSYRRSRT